MVNRQWGMGCLADLSWAMALEDDPGHVTESTAILAGIPDAAIRSAVRNRLTSADRSNVANALGAAAPPEPGPTAVAHLRGGGKNRRDPNRDPNSRRQSRPRKNIGTDC